MKKAIFTIVMMAAVGLAAGQASAVTLGELLPDLMAKHERVKGAEAAKESADYGVDSAMGGYYPSVDLAADANREEVDKPTGPEGETALLRNSQTARVSQLLYDFGGTESLVESAEAMQGQAEANLQNTRQQLMYEGVAAYLNVLKAYKRLESDRSSEQRFKEQTGLEESMVERGAGLAQDVLQAKAKLAQARSRRVLGQGQLANASNRFKAVFDRAIDEPMARDFRRPPAPFAKLPLSVDEAVEAALKDNPQIKAARKAMDVAAAAINTADAAFYPRFGLWADVQRKENDGGTEGPRVDNNLGAEVSWNIYRGGTDTANLRQAKSNWQQARFALMDLQRTIEEQVRVSWQNLLTYRETADYLRNQSNILGEFLDLARKDKKMGGPTTLLDILISEVDYVNARSDAVSAEVDTMLAAYQLLLTIGSLDVDMFR